MKGTSTVCFAKLAKKYRENAQSSIGVSSRDQNFFKATALVLNHDLVRDSLAPSE